MWLKAAPNRCASLQLQIVISGHLLSGLQWCCTCQTSTQWSSVEWAWQYWPHQLLA